MPYQVEVTDTFGGEANYSWVKRYTFDLPVNKSKRSLVIKAKKLAGYTGIKCDTTDFGDEVHIRPRNICHIIFVTWIESLPETNEEESC